MIRSKKLAGIILFILFLPAVLRAESLPECRARGGLPNCFQKLEAGSEVRIAYLGGSITEADGWRVLSRQWFATNYPQAKVSEIRATISGTGAEFGVCRLEKHVLKYEPDLVFVEFAVNGTGNSDRRSIRTVEGIVRQIWKHNPRTDICLVYTVSEGSLKALQRGRETRCMQLMEEVAAHYNVPTIHLGLEVARLEAAGKLIFKGKKPETEAEKQALGDKIIFSADGTHPFTDAGHPFYLAAIVRSVPALKAAGQPGAHPLPAPLDPENWEQAQLVALEDLQRSGNWQKVPPPGETEARQRISQYLPSVWQTTQRGATLEFAFRGTCFGLAGFRGPDAGQFAVTVDGGPVLKSTLYDSYAYAGRVSHRAWFFPQDLTNGLHRVKLEFLAEPPDKAAILKAKGLALTDREKNADSSLTLGALLIAGELVSDTDARRHTRSQ